MGNNFNKACPSGNHMTTSCNGKGRVGRRLSQEEIRIIRENHQLGKVDDKKMRELGFGIPSPSKKRSKNVK